jgi:hypothetical protein
MNLPRYAAPLLSLITAVAASAQEVKTLQDYETPADLRAWDFKSKAAALSTEHATRGTHSIKITTPDYLFSNRVPRNWSGYDSLELDVFVEGDVTVTGSVLVGDDAWKAKGGSYWNRHNGSFTLRPGANVLSIPVNGLYRGEAGSRNNDIKTNIDPKTIVRLDIGFGTKDKAPATLYLDHLRLTKESRPAGILAFDLGPTSQMVSPGFTAIGPETVYGKGGNRAGLNYAGTNGQTRDDTFPTRLYRDCIVMDGFIFTADAEKSATYHGWVVYDDLGYWGGEAAPFKKRQILANNEVVFTQDRGDAGPTDYLYKFETIEPRPADKVWDLYMKDLFAPKRFTCKADADGKIRLKFTADAGLSCKVAAIVLYPESIKADGDKWVAEVEARNRAEFEARAQYIPPKPQRVDPPADAAAAKGYWLGYPSMEQDVTFADPPGATEGKLSRPAARGQRVSFTFAIRPLKDFAGPVQLTGTELKANDGNTIPATEIDLRYVHHGTHRTYNDIAYSIGPDTLRPLAGANLKLAKDETRQFWVTVHVPADAKAGEYRTDVTLSVGDLTVTMPLTVAVQPFALDEPDFSMGYYGTHVPPKLLAARGDDAYRDLFKTLRDAGMNSFSGGPNIPFKGLDPAGKPILDFTAVDRFMKLAREAGFTKRLDGYGGPGLVLGLHESHAVGETGRAWEKKTGKPFPELLKIVWSAVRDHAKEANWLPILYEMTDEPRVLAQAQSQLELMRLYREHVPFVNIGGSYSVRWDGKTPFDLAVQEIFKTLAWSSLNLHTQADLDKAKDLGKAIHIYNQGSSRFYFGAYHWAEMHKGVRGRMQWHVLALHGYQFFDLDGREPDTAMINWTSNGIVPSIHLARCREGADDFRYAVTLWNLAQKQEETPAGKAAIAWLEDVSRHIPVGKSKRPDGFMDDEAFRTTCVTRINQLTAAQ